MVPRQIRYLLAVAEHKNFTRAADALGVSQPGLSQQIKQLEDYLGTTLFDRTGRSIRLTDAGETYVAHARKALFELEAGWRALQEVEDLSRGVLRVACTPSFSESLMPRWVHSFHERYPNVHVYMSEMSLDAIEAALCADESDIGVGFTDVRTDDILVTPLFEERATLIVSSTHPWRAAGVAITPEQLATVPLVMLVEGFAARTHADTYFRAHKITPNIAIEANSISAVLKVVQLGGMATVLPQVSGDVPIGLSHLDLPEPITRRTVAILERQRVHRTAAAKAFAKLVMSSTLQLGHGALSADDMRRADTGGLRTRRE
ncbi:HTH-type transcriptional regulator CynR [Pandoraea terrigena]|uniref:HTH-type transcriptional regulator CynR n=1 Tax=Pandoraea terrigena TaxID=2508292 RepID=A0A5E4UR83_9BURK|nr:HTH-type transcriptional regulator CynR [Pandoraea terrigena]